MKIIESMDLAFISGAGLVKITDDSLFLPYGTDLELSFGQSSIGFSSTGNVSNLVTNDACTLSDGVPLYIEGYGFITGSNGAEGYSYNWKV